MIKDKRNSRTIPQYPKQVYWKNEISFVESV